MPVAPASPLPSPTTPSARRFRTALARLLRSSGIASSPGSRLPVAGPSTEASGTGPLVGRVQTFVDAHLAADLTLDRLAAVVDRSPSTLVRRFKDELDTTPWRYVMERRVAAAKRLLDATDRSLAAVAVDTGFYDQAHLTRTFRRLEGRTPGEYRADDTTAPDDAPAVEPEA